MASLQEGERMTAISEEDKAHIEAKYCDVCKHCYYMGPLGALTCEIKEKYTGHFDTCEKWELPDYWEMNAE